MAARCCTNRTPDVGLASAGQGARAKDASAVFTNPAGMTQLEGSQLLVGAEPLFGNFTFSPQRQEMPVCQNAGPIRGTVAGQFTNTFINFFSLNLTYKFGID